MQSTVLHTTTRRFSGLATLSCLVAWCCCPLFGLIAYILVLVARDTDESGETGKATRLSRASLGMSIAGIIAAVIIMTIVLSVRK